MKTLETLFFDQLAETYDAELRLVKTLPKLVEAANHPKLKAAMAAHLAETEGHVKKVEQVFDAFGMEARTIKNMAAFELLQGAEESTLDHAGSATLDAALISAAQKVNHLEIASYGCLRTWAELLGNSRAELLLSEILVQEKADDEKLTLLALKTCNPAAKDTGKTKPWSAIGDNPAKARTAAQAKLGAPSQSR